MHPHPTSAVLYFCQTSSRAFDNLPSINDNLLINPGLSITILNSLVGADPTLVHVNVKEAHSSVISSVATITAKACTATVAHPERRVTGGVLGEAAVFVYMVTKGRGMLVWVWCICRLERLTVHS